MKTKKPKQREYLSGLLMGLGLGLDPWGSTAELLCKHDGFADKEKTYTIAHKLYQCSTKLSNHPESVSLKTDKEKKGFYIGTVIGAGTQLFTVGLVSVATALVDGVYNSCRLGKKTIKESRQNGGLEEELCVDSPVDGEKVFVDPERLGDDYTNRSKAIRKNRNARKERSIESILI